MQGQHVEVSVPQTAQQPTFLPLTTAAAKTAVESLNDPPVRAAAEVVWRRAAEADSAAADCWMALLANCDSPGRRSLASRLHALTEATAIYAGTRWWHAEGSHHRWRVAEAQYQLVEAARDSDGEEFAEAFIGYDQAVATVIVAIQSRLGSPA
jgi:hypothetical protein